MATTFRYTEDQKKEALRAYVDYGRNLSKTADETGIPYNSMRPWIASDWGKLFMASYELETKRELVSGATKEVLDIKVEHFKTEAEFITETEKIMVRVIKRMNELIGNEKNLRNITELFKAMNDIITQFRAKSDEKYDGEFMSEKTKMIMNVIQNQLNVPPGYIQDLPPKKQ